MKRRDSGQALLEYIMILFIAVLMVMGLVYQFNDAFRQYTDAWFKGDEGGYLFCLIENGYLPGESEDCQMPQFNLNNGKTLNAQGLGGGGAKGGKYTPPASNGGGVGRANEGRSGGVVPGPNFSGGFASGANGAGSKDSTGNTGFSSDANALGKANSKTGGVASAQSSRYIRYGDLDDSLAGGSKSKPVPVTEEDLKPARTVAMEKARLKRKAMDDEEARFSFGNIFKYVIIFFLIFGIIFFVGSQLFAISRGGRKRE